MSCLELVIVLTLGWHVALVHPSPEVRRTSQLPKLSNLQVYNNTLYVGGLNRLYSFDEDLNTLQSVDTCTGQCSSNYNKVMLLNETGKELMVCGTGNGGICERRHLSDLSSIIFASDRSDSTDDVDKLCVGTDRNRPAVAMMWDKELFLMAVSYGENVSLMRTSTHHSYYALTLRQVRFEVLHIGNWFPSRVMFELIYTRGSSLNDYVVYYKGAIQHQTYTYLLTNQKAYVGSDTFVSKVVRLCNFDPSLTSYVDMELACHVDGVKYNLIQGSTITNLHDTDYLIASFAKSSNPEDVAGTGVLCAIPMAVINSNLTQAKEEFVNGYSFKLSERYLFINTIWEFNEYINETVPCTSDYDADSIPFRYYAISTNIATMEAVARSSPEEGYFTSIQAYTHTDTNIATVFAGTSNGYLVKFVETNNNFERYETTVVERGVRIQNIYIKDDESFYVLTSQSVVKYGATNCGRFSTCEEVMEARDPQCGWCMYAEKSSRRHSCPYRDQSNHWLSIHNRCLSISLSANGHQVGSEPFNVSVLNPALPSRQPGDVYKCMIKNRQTQYSVEKAGDKYVCKNIANQLSHEKTELAFIVETNGKSVVLAYRTFLFYKCTAFTGCSACTTTVGANCIWCPTQGTCTPPSNQTCDLHVDNTFGDRCPALKVDRNLYIPTQTPVTIDFEVLNFFFDESKTFDVELVSEGFITSKCRLWQGHIQCTVTYQNSVDSKQTKDVKIKYRHNLGAASFTYLEGSANVTVYNCTALSSGHCNFCGALNPEFYQCRWHDNRCVFGAGEGDICPPPTITQILPLDGLPGPGVVVTVTGTEFGTELDHISEVLISDKRCMPNSLKDLWDDTGSDDFSLMIREGFLCDLGPFINPSESVTELQLFFGNTSSANTSRLQLPLGEPVWKLMSVTAMEPTRGPALGGTLITFSGENLGIGNRIVERVVFYSSDISVWNCIDPTIQPSYPPAILPVTKEENFTIVCMIPMNIKILPGTTAYFQFITVPGGQIVIRDKRLSFTFLENPSNLQIRPLGPSGFVSGGTTLTVIGYNLENANPFKIEIVRTDESGTDETEAYLPSSKRNNDGCVFDMRNNSTVVLCKVPPASDAIVDTLRGTDNVCHPVTMMVGMNGLTHEFTFSYCADPTITTFSGEIGLRPENPYITIAGTGLNAANIRIDDVEVFVGDVECDVKAVLESEIFCKLLVERLQPGAYPVKVYIGNLIYNPGNVVYKRDDGDKKGVNVVVVVLAAVLAMVVTVVIIVVVVVFIWMKRHRSERLDRRPIRHETVAPNIESANGEGLQADLDAQSHAYSQVALNQADTLTENHDAQNRHYESLQIKSGTNTATDDPAMAYIQLDLAGPRDRTTE